MPSKTKTSEMRLTLLMNSSPGRPRCEECGRLMQPIKVGYRDDRGKWMHQSCWKFRQSKKGK